MSDRIDYYEILEVARDAKDHEIKASYRRLAMRYHPDRNPGDQEAEAHFKNLNRAYECLKDPQKRAMYDHFGSEDPAQGGQGFAHNFGGLGDIFEDIFGGMAGRGARQQNGAMHGEDQRCDIAITLEDAYQGKQIELDIDSIVTCDPCEGRGAAADSASSSCHTCHGHGRVRVNQGLFVIERECPTCHGMGEVPDHPCDHCHGMGRVPGRKQIRVNLPAGIDEGTGISLAGQGHAGARGAPAGDLYVFVQIKPHRIFKRQGTTLYTMIPISMTRAALGGEIEVPGLDQKNHTLTIAPGTQSGKHLRLRGRGMPTVNGHGSGDMIIEIEVETPVRLTPRQQELLEEFAGIEHDNKGHNSPRSSGVFAKLKEFWHDLTASAD